MSVAIEIRAEGNAVAALAAAAERLGDLAPLHGEIGRAMVRSTRERFLAEEDPQGNVWPASVRAKLMYGPMLNKDGALAASGPTLRDTGALFRSITMQADRQGVRVGSNSIYAAIHQFGGTITAKTARGLRFRPAGGADFVTVRSVTLPRRAYLGVSTEDEAEIVAMAGEFMAESLGGGDAVG